MAHVKTFILVLCIVTLGSLSVYKPCSAEASLERKALILINKAVFEVVVLKPTKESLTYEKALPLDLLPYVERTDKYRSVGTAFAISPTEIVTAAHVLALDQESQYTDYFIRDINGNVYAIDKILKYSSRRDFVVFSVKDRGVGEYLPINTDPELNSKVYAVGNALGEGIVVRDGLYTSNTPEDQNGEWKWLRFSAAASPGNSGGPLLDEAGTVIGIVLQKSPNENLNIALPIIEVKNSKSDAAHIYLKMVYFLDNMPMTKIDTLQQETSLPKPYRQLNKEITTTVEQFSTKLLERLLSENQPQIFPNGKESLSLLNKHYHENYPRMIMKGEDGNWDGYSPATRGLELGNNGFISFGVVKNSALMRIKKPDNITLDAFYKDSKIFMDTILKGLSITRQVGLDKIKITSLGKAEYESIYTDKYERKWLIRYWNAEYNDTRFVTISLPVPGGCITLMRGGATWRTPGHIMDFKTLADFIYVSYCGSLKDWREFLTMGELLPDVFSTINISFDYGKQITFKSKRLSFSLDQTNMTITENSELHLSFGYFNEGNRTVWDIKEVSAGEDKNTVTNYKLTRYTNPPSDLSDKDKSNWRKLAAREVPYNKSSFIEDNSTKIETVYTGHFPEGSLRTAAVLYRVAYRKEGSWGQKDMVDALEAFQKKVIIFGDGYSN
jgi:serine protease Do